MRNRSTTASRKRGPSLDASIGGSGRWRRRSVRVAPPGRVLAGNRSRMLLPASRSRASGEPRVPSISCPTATMLPGPAHIKIAWTSCIGSPQTFRFSLHRTRTAPARCRFPSRDLVDRGQAGVPKARSRVSAGYRRSAARNPHPDQTSKTQERAGYSRRGEKRFPDFSGISRGAASLSLRQAHQGKRRAGRGFL